MELALCKQENGIDVLGIDDLDPVIGFRVQDLRDRKASKAASNCEQIAFGVMQKNVQLLEEVERLRCAICFLAAENDTLKARAIAGEYKLEMLRKNLQEITGRLVAALGWPRRLMLPEVA